jgi:hypothetical protein
MALTLTAAMAKDQELQKMKEDQARMQKTLDLILKHPEVADAIRQFQSTESLEE